MGKRESEESKGKDKENGNEIESLDTASKKRKIDEVIEDGTDEVASSNPPVLLGDCDSNKLPHQGDTTT